MEQMVVKTIDSYSLPEVIEGLGECCAGLWMEGRGVPRLTTYASSGYKARSSRVDSFFFTPTGRVTTHSHIYIQWHMIQRIDRSSLTLGS